MRRCILGISLLSVVLLWIGDRRIAAADLWWDGGAADGALNNPANWDQSADATGGDPATVAGANATVAIDRFSGGPPTTFTNLSLATLRFNDRYFGWINLACGAPQTLTLTATNALVNLNADPVVFGSNITLAANNPAAVSIDGGPGRLVVRETLNRAGGNRRTLFHGAVRIGRIAGNYQTRLGGTGSLMLTGANSDFDVDLHLEQSLVVTLAGAGSAMLDDRPLFLDDAAALVCAASNQIADAQVLLLNDTATLDLNGMTETVSGLGTYDAGSRPAVNLHGGHLIIDGGNPVYGNMPRPFTGSVIDTGTRPGQITKRGAGTQSFGPESGAMRFAGAFHWDPGNGAVSLDGAKALSTPLTVASLNVLLFNAPDALDGKSITVKAGGRLEIGGSVTAVNSPVVTEAYAAILGGTPTLTSAQLDALAAKTLVQADPAIPLQGMPADRIIAALPATADLTADLRVDPRGANAAGYRGVGAAQTSVTLTDTNRAGRVIRYWQGLDLAALPGRTLAIQVPIVNGSGAGPVTVGGAGAVSLDAVNRFAGALNVAPATRLNIGCDPDGNRIPDAGSLGNSTEINLGEGSTLAFLGVPSGTDAARGAIALGTRSLNFKAVTDPTIEVGAGLDVRVNAGQLTSAGGSLTKTGPGQLTLMGFNPRFAAGEVTRIDAGVVELRASAALNGRSAAVSPGAAYAVTFNASQTDLNRVTTDSEGIFAINGTITENLSLRAFGKDTTSPPDGVPDAATLFLGSTSTGTVSGTLTGVALDTNADAAADRGRLQLGGGGGVLTVTSGLSDVNPGAGALPTDLVGSGSAGSRGVVILAGPNTFTGRVIPNQTLFVFASASALPGAANIEVGTGSAPSIQGNGRVNPLIMDRNLDARSFLPREVLLDGGQVGWHDPRASGSTKAIAALDEVGRYLAGTSTPTLVTLGLGSGQGNVNLGLQFAVNDFDHDGNGGTPPVPVRLVKDGTAVLDMTHTSQQGNRFSGGTEVRQGTLRVNRGDALGASGLLRLGPGSTVESTATLSLGSRLEPANTKVIVAATPIEDAQAGGATLRAANEGAVVSVTGNLAIASATTCALVIDGPGKTRIAPTNNLNDQGFGLYVKAGATVEFNQMPDRRDLRSGLTSGNLCGALIVDNGSVTRFLAGGVGANDGAFREFSVRGKAEVFVDAGLSLDVSAQQAVKMPTGSWFVKTGPGTVRFGVNPILNLGTEVSTGGGIYDVRAGFLDLQANGLKGGKSGHKGYSSNTSFHLQHGAAAGIVSGSPEAVFWRDFQVNPEDQPGIATIVSLRAWEAGNSASPLISGNTVWGKSGGTNGAALRLAAGTVFRFNRVGPSVTTVNAPAAAIQIDSGAGCVLAGGTVDPFHDPASGRSVSIVNNSTLAAGSGGGFRITAGTKRIASLSGTGTASVTNGTLRVGLLQGGTVAVRRAATLLVDAFSPGAGIGTVFIQSEGTTSWIGGGPASLFEVDPNARLADGVRVAGTPGEIALDPSAGQFVVNVALAAGAQAPTGAVLRVEILNAAAIHGFREADFVVRTGAGLPAGTRILKEPGPVSGESLYLVNRYQPVLTDIDTSPSVLSLRMSVPGAPGSCTVERCFSLVSNDWVAVARLPIDTPEILWTQPITGRWGQVFYRLKLE